MTARRRDVPITRMRIADSGSGTGTTTSVQPVIRYIRERAAQNKQKTPTEQLWNNLGRTVGDGVLNRPFQIGEDLTALCDALDGRGKVVIWKDGKGLVRSQSESGPAGSHGEWNLPSRIMFAASLDTSEPEIFMAIPRSAFLRAGESLTPSPVLLEIFISGTQRCAE